MPNTPPVRSGFTLIELMMALAMGSIIILIATTGVRAASQTMTMVTRLSFQNNLLREGFIAACNEVDFWTQVDDPGQPDRQVSRQVNTNGSGCAFTPFTRSWPTGVLKAAYDGGQAERLLGWSPSPMAWAPFDARSWNHSNTAERAQANANGSGCSDLRYGDYSLFENTDPMTPPAPTNPWNSGLRCRSWFANQLKGTIDAMGFFGLYEYLPSNILWAYHGRPPIGAPAIVTQGGMAAALSHNGGWLACSDGPHQFPRGRYRATRCASQSLPNPNDPESMRVCMASGGRSSSSDPFRTWWSVGENIDGYGGDKLALINTFLDFTRFDENLMQVRPSEWPGMVIETHHYVKNARMISINMLNIFDPLNGSRTTLPFSCFGTTLRGARQQRSTGLVNGGWATYNNANPQVIQLSPTLDWHVPRTISR